MFIGVIPIHGTRHLCHAAEFPAASVVLMSAYHIYQFLEFLPRRMMIGDNVTS
jgi:hypothetical protein